jgi:hypothetical protein
MSDNHVLLFISHGEWKALHPHKDLCKFDGDGRKCTNAWCTYVHLRDREYERKFCSDRDWQNYRVSKLEKKCKYGEECTKNECYFMHVEDDLDRDDDYEVDEEEVKRRVWKGARDRERRQEEEKKGKREEMTFKNTKYKITNDKYKKEDKEKKEEKEKEEKGRKRRKPEEEKEEKYPKRKREDEILQKKKRQIHRKVVKNRDEDERKSEERRGQGRREEESQEGDGKERRKTT